MTMPRALLLMSGLGLLAALVGLPLLLAPERVRRRLGWRGTPQLVYILRIVGTMLAALALILLVFATTYGRSAA